MQLWGGQMRQRCYSTNLGTILDDTAVCSPGLNSSNTWNPAINRQGAATGLRVCPQGSECLALMQPRFQGQHHDNIGASTSVILQIVTLKGWIKNLTRLQEAFSPLMLLPYLAMLLFGPMYLIFMFQVVLIKTLAELRHAEHNKQLRFLSARRSAVSLSVSFSLWADITICSSVLARNSRMKRYVVSNGFDYRFRAYVQVRFSYSHWHSQCASVIMGEVPGSNVLAAHKELEIAETQRIDPLLAEDPTKQTKKRKLRTKSSLLRRLAMSKTLESSISGVIVLNTVSMMMDMDRKSFTGTLWQNDDDFRKYLGSLEILNIIFTSIFTVECLVKIVGMGRDAIHGDHLFWPGAQLAFFRNGFNIFDFFVVILTGIQIPDSMVLVRCYLLGGGDASACSSGNAGVSILRMFRLARLVRLLRMFPQVQQQVMNLITIARPAAAQSVLIFIFIVIFAIMGKDLLGTHLIGPPSDLSQVVIRSRVYVRSKLLPGNFSRVHPARVLQVQEHLSLPVQVEVVTGWSMFGSIFGTLWVRLSDSKWDELNGWTEEECQRQSRRDLNEVESVCEGGVMVGVVPRANFETMQDGLLTTFQLFALEDWPVIAMQARLSIGPAGEVFVYVILALGNLLLLNVFVAIVSLGFAAAAKDAAKKKARGIQNSLLPPPSLSPPPPPLESGNSDNTFSMAGVPLRVCGLAAGGQNDPTIRYYMGVFVTSKLFDRAILGGIVLSTVLLSIETYPPVTGAMRNVINDANTAANILFAVELILKVVWFGPINYIQNGWNKMDAFIVFTSLIDEILSSVAAGLLTAGEFYAALCKQHL